MSTRVGQFKKRRSNDNRRISWSRKVKCRKINYVLWRDGFYWVIRIKEVNVNNRGVIAAQLISARRRFGKWISENEVIHCGGCV